MEFSYRVFQSFTKAFGSNSPHQCTQYCENLLNVTDFAPMEGIGVLEMPLKNISLAQWLYISLGVAEDLLVGSRGIGIGFVEMDDAVSAL